MIGTESTGPPTPVSPAIKPTKAPIENNKNFLSLWLPALIMEGIGRSTATPAKTMIHAIIAVRDPDPIMLLARAPIPPKTIPPNVIGTTSSRRRFPHFQCRYVPNIAVKKKLHNAVPAAILKLYCIAGINRTPPTLVAPDRNPTTRQESMRIVNKFISFDLCRH
jgi:hypothetical protein